MTAKNIADSRIFQQRINNLRPNSRRYDQLRDQRAVPHLYAMESYALQPSTLSGVA